VVRALIGKARTNILAYDEARAQLITMIGQMARNSAQVNNGAGQASPCSLARTARGRHR
jgi:hypothetical protein